MFSFALPGTMWAATVAAIIWWLDYPTKPTKSCCQVITKLGLCRLRAFAFQQSLAAVHTGSRLHTWSVSGVFGGCLLRGFLCRSPCLQQRELSISLAGVSRVQQWTVNLYLRSVPLSADRLQGIVGPQLAFAHSPPLLPHVEPRALACSTSLYGSC